MFKRSFASKDRAGKSTKVSTRRSYVVGTDKKARLLEQSLSNAGQPMSMSESSIPRSPSQLTSAIVTIAVGKEQRLFAAHEDVLTRAPFFKAALKQLFFDNNTGPKRLCLSTEEPEIFSLVLEYLYKGDYTPRLHHDKRAGYYLEGGEGAGYQSENMPMNSPLSSPRSPGAIQSTLYHNRAEGTILRDTAVYCAGEAYGLSELKKSALRKQGLQTGVEVAVILRSMRFAYNHTPDTDSRLRAHYLALIVRSRKTFKRSGTMQIEMVKGGAMFFDLFVAMCNHLDDVTTAANMSPRTV